MSLFVGRGVCVCVCVCVGGGGGGGGTQGGGHLHVGGGGGPVRLSTAVINNTKGHVGAAVRGRLWFF